MERGWFQTGSRACNRRINQVRGRLGIKCYMVMPAGKGYFCQPTFWGGTDAKPEGP
jgi:hypothetical protein